MLVMVIRYTGSLSMLAMMADILCWLSWLASNGD